MRALDLFSGAGGLSCGFEWAGGTVVGGVEYDTNAAASFAANHPDANVWAADIRSVPPNEVRKQIGDVDVILGGPMCQGFSQRGPRNPHEDPRNFAFWSFAEYVRELQPQAFLVENVPALVSDVHNRALAVAVFEELEDLGYHLSAEVVNAAWFGVPQLRYRLLVIGSKVERKSFPRQVERGLLGSLTESSFTTVEDALADLPPVEAGGGWDQAEMPDAPQVISGYGRLMRDGASALYNHWSSDTDEVNLRRIRFVSEGGNWHDIPEEFLPPRFLSVRPSDHTTTYRRLSRAHPAYTITTECGNVTSGAYTHPTQHRAITVREAARLQGFPDHFRFMGPKNSQYRQVGNAVPPLMAKAISETMLLEVEASHSTHKGRITLDLLQRYPDSKVPFSLAPRYKPLFGRSAGALKRAASKDARSQDVLELG